MVAVATAPGRPFVREDVEHILHLCGVCRERCLAAFAAPGAADNPYEQPVRISDVMCEKLLKIRRDRLRFKHTCLPARFLPNEAEPRRHLSGFLQFMDCSRRIWERLPGLQVKPMIISLKIVTTILLWARHETSFH